MTDLTRLEDRADLQISIVLLASWAAISLSVNWGNWPPDLSALFMAGHFWAEGRPELIYAAPEGFFGPGVESWASELEKLGHEGESFFPFVYPPIWAVVAAPLTEILGAKNFFNLFYSIHVVMIAACIWLSYRLIRPPVPLVVWCVISCGLLLLSIISKSALYHNQLQIMVTFLIILSFERYRAGASKSAGIALGLAAALKITPAALGIIFLMDRDAKAASATATTGILLLALSYLVAGPELHSDFLATLSEISSQTALMHVNWNLEALLVQLKTLAIGPPLHNLNLTPNMAIDEPLWVSVLAKGIGLGLAVLVLIRTHGMSKADALRLRPFGLILAMTLAAPLGWSHHYLPILLLIPALLTFMPPVRAIAMLALFGGLTSLGAFSLIKPYGTVVHAQALLNIAVMLAVFALFFARPARFRA